jgi:hypothetical protein
VLSALLQRIPRVGELGTEEKTNLKHVDSSIEEINHLIAALIPIPITARRKCIDTSPMFVPLMLPEILRRAAVWQPVCVHEGQEIGLFRRFEDLGNIVVRRGLLAERWVGAIAEIRPISHYQLMFRNYARETYHSPCKVQESAGPIAGSASQNCVCRSWPPG